MTDGPLYTFKKKWSPSIQTFSKSMMTVSQKILKELR